MGCLFGFTGPRDDALAHAMARVLAHRGGDVVIDAADRLTLGVRTWRERDEGARRDAQLTREGVARDGRRTLALGGHLLPRPGVSSGLAALLQRFAREGPTCVESLGGAFVLALVAEQRLHLVRDGAGARTLYWARHQGRVLFASEPKGIVAAPGFPRRLRPAALAQYLTFSFVPGEGTMLEGVFELLPGEVLTFDLDDVSAPPRAERFFRIDDHARDGAAHDDMHDDMHDDEWVARFRTQFGAAVGERLPASDTAVGVFLSGGIDSSVVAAEVKAQHDGPVKTYSIHFGANYAHELDFAREVATRCGTEHEEVLISPHSFLPRLRKILWHLDDPIGDPITVPNYELAAHVARDVDVVFNGEGGDPVFGGPKNIPMLLSHWYGGVERGPRFREQAYLASYRRGYEEVFRLLSPELRAAIDAERDLESLVTPFFDGSQLFLDKLIALNVRMKGAHLILPKVERMTGAVGITAFSPLFDERMLRLSRALPAHLKLAGGVEKIAMKRAFQGRVPDSVIKRPKSGMRVPVHHWFQGELKRYARHVLDKKRLSRQGILDPERVSRLLAYDTDEGQGRYGIRLWMLLTFELWRSIVVDGEPP